MCYNLKLQFFTVFLLSGALFVSAQNVVKQDSDVKKEIKPSARAIVMPFYDADSVQVGTYYYMGNKLDSTIYFKTKRHKVKALFEMPPYQGGYDSLKQFFEQEFRKTSNENVDGMALVYILLEGGKVTDVKIADRIGYNKKHDNKVKEIVYQTKDNWQVNEQKVDSPLLFVYLFTLKNKTGTE